MEGSSKYQIAQTAHVKIVLHALKHPHRAVSGLLVGRVRELASDNGLTKPTSEGDWKVEIVDSLPLFHDQHGLLPVLELALSQAEEYLLAKKDGLIIVGYYHGNERLDDNEICPLARRIGDHIYRYTPEAAVLLLNNRSLESLKKGISKTPVVQLYTRDAVHGWQENADLILKEATANSILGDSFLEKRNLLIDFDDHLTDIRKDWLSPDLLT